MDCRTNIDISIQRKKGKQTHRQKDRQDGGNIGRQTMRQTGRLFDKQTDTQKFIQR